MNQYAGACGSGILAMGGRPLRVSSWTRRGPWVRMSSETGGVRHPPTASAATRTIEEHRMTPEDILAPHIPKVAALAQRLRAIVKRALPESEERTYPVWKGIGYVHPEAGYLCAIFPYRDYVALAFEFGALLHDDEGLLRPGRTSGKKVRYLEVRTARDIKPKAIETWLEQSVALRTRR